MKRLLARVWTVQARRAVFIAIVTLGIGLGFVLGIREATQSLC